MDSSIWRALASMAAGSAIFSTGPASDISTSPFRNRMRSASASTWPISVMAVRLNSAAKRRENPIVEVYVEIHVLVNGQELFGDRLVQQGDTCCRVHK